MLKTILIVDDEALIAMSIEMQLQDMGFETLVAQTTAVALQHLEAFTVDLAVLDYKLQDGKTTPIAEALRARRIPFVVCSGSQFQGLAGVFDGAPVIKPFDVEDLGGTVLSLLQDQSN